MRIPRWFNFTNYLAFTLVLWQLLPRVLGIKIGEYKVDLNHIAVIFLIGVWMLKKFLKRESLYVYKNAITLFLLLFMLMQTISLVAATNLYYSLVEWFINLFLLCFVYFIISDQIKSINDCRKILNTVAYTCSVIAVAGCFEYFTGINLFGQSEESIYYVSGRISGPFEGQIVFGNYLAFAIFTVFYKLVEKEGLKNLIIWSALLLITLFALIFSGTRGSIIPVAIAFGVSPFIGFKVLHLKKSIRIMVYLIILVTVFPCLISVLPIDTSFLKGRFISGYQGLYGEEYMGETEEGHFLGMKYVMPAILRLDNVLIGYGPGSPFNPKLWAKILENAPELDSLHNWSPSVIQGMALEGGILSSIILISLLVYPIFLLFRGLTTEKEYQRNMIAYSLFLAFLAFAGSLVFSWHRHVLFLFFAFLGLMQAVLHVKRVKVKL